MQSMIWKFYSHSIWLNVGWNATLEPPRLGLKSQLYHLRSVWSWPKSLNVFAPLFLNIS